MEHFSGWARHMLDHSHVRTMLDRAQVTRAIHNHHDIPGMVALLARWCVPTHTFICIWGEFTITLEDVVALLHLPITGNFPEELSAEDNVISDVLEITTHEFNKSPKNFYSQWLKHWWPRDILTVAAFFV